MKRYTYFLVFGIIIIASSLTFCEKKAPVAGPPEAKFVVSPENGQTTTNFSFNTAGTTNPGLENPELYFRWDWDGDGIWDTHFSKSREYTHRYYTPGDFIAQMEVRNVTGLMDTITTPISVTRGNSAPYPFLKVDPQLGHIKTNFVFDASDTYDDEDSLSTLQFRWDWTGDGVYDTPYSNNTTIEHTFDQADRYRVVMEVTDPWGMTAKTNKLIDVSNLNPLLVVDFTWNPDNGTTSDIITLDASASYDPEDPSNVFQYRWDFENDGFYDTEWLENPSIEKVFKEEGEREIRLQVMDQYGLVKGVTKEIFVYHSNQPPSASFEVATSYGNLTTIFYFDAEAVRDDEDFFNILEVRWDFESDGVYDTDFSMTKTATHFYGIEGDFTVTMQVKDSGGLTATMSKVIYISSGTNQTDYVIDSDRGTMYGAVKIGTQWWLSENVDATGGRSCYRNSQENCETYGGLYTWPTAMNNSISPKAQGICPDGWHIPTTDEWETLFSYFGEENARAELEVGGSSDFRMQYAGQINAAGFSEYMGSVVNFWASTKLTGSNAWSYSLQAGKDQVWKITLGQAYKISVRCIKN